MTLDEVATHEDTDRNGAAEAHDPQGHDAAAHGVVEVRLQHLRQARDDHEVREAEHRDRRECDGDVSDERECCEQERKREQRAAHDQRLGVPGEVGADADRTERGSEAEGGVEKAVGLTLLLDPEVRRGDLGHQSHEHQ